MPRAVGAQGKRGFKRALRNLKEFLDLADVPPEIEWFANITNPQTRRAYQNDLKDFMHFARISNPEVFRVVTRAHLIAWRKDLESRGCEGATIRRKLSAVSSLCEYLCKRNAVVHNPVKGVKRPKATVYEGLTPALSDEQARMLLDAPPAHTLKGKRDRAILATLLYHGLRREELCKLRVRGLQQREGVLHFRVHGKGDKTRYIPVGLKAQRLITEYLEAARHKEDFDGALFRPVKNNITKILVKHLHPDSVYQGIVKRYGAMVGINADVHGFCVHALTRYGSDQCAWRTTPTLPRCRSGWGMPTLPRRGSTIAGRVGQRRSRHLKWNIERAKEKRQNR